LAAGAFEEVVRFADVRFAVLFEVVRFAEDFEDFEDFEVFDDDAVERLAGDAELDGFAAARLAVERFAAGAFGSGFGFGCSGSAAWTGSPSQGGTSPSLRGFGC
jgi:hypothetical protein